MLIWTVLYLTVGLFLAEGAWWAGKKNGEPFDIKPYAVILLLWPIVLLLTLFRK